MMDVLHFCVIKIFGNVGSLVCKPFVAITLYSAVERGSKERLSQLNQRSYEHSVFNFASPIERMFTTVVAGRPWHAILMASLN